MKRKLLTTSFVIAAFGALAVAGCSISSSDGAATAGTPGAESTAVPAAGKDGAESTDKKKEETPAPVTSVASRVGAIATYISATANLVAEHDVKVLAEAEGRVSRVHKEEGDTVSGGNTLAELDREDASIAFKKAQVRATQARLAFERAERMMGEQLISREDFDKASVDDAVAKQELAEASRLLSKTTITSPLAGRVTRRLVQPGQHVRPGDELYAVADFDPLIARIHLSERDVVGLREGQEVRIRLKADENVIFAGKIRQISPVVDVTTGTVKVTVEAVSPPEIVRPGGFATIEIVRERHDAAVLVPRTAVLRELQRAHVFIVKADRAEKREIALGMEEGADVEVVSGLADGERVIVAGQGSLKDGAAIKEIAPPASASAAKQDA
ncbi:MAG: efflux RND transporter periplasmic adaptor subunit [Candidatus Schekmanbacteria bacterium]|nr:efflux RND transporter periplasmic adaptor subunit [Candidatus Schekmanbacteria bacterium]